VPLGTLGYDAASHGGSVSTHLNAICFGGGGLVGTAKALGHLVGFDQIVRDPTRRTELKKSFFDYMAEAGVPLRELEPRLDEVFDRMPAHVRSGRSDYVSQYFNVAVGISGGSLLATGLISGIPLVELVRESLTFPVNYYFVPDWKEYARGLRNLPLVPFRVAKLIAHDLRRGQESLSPNAIRRGRRTLPYIRRYSRLTCELLASFHDILPRGLFSGDGIVRYVEELSARYGLANSFDTVKEAGRHLFIITERFNASQTLSNPSDLSTTIYFGMPPYDKTPVSHAIRASCSIPGITTPYRFVDHARDGRTYDLVDGAIGKTIGRRRILGQLPIDLVVTVNPIVPYSGPLENVLDNMEQLYRKLIYSRLKAVEAYLDADIKDRTVHLESKPEDFFYNMLRVDKMREGLFEGYYQTLKYCAENYVTINDRLRRGGLCLIPRTEIFRLVTKSSTVRERAYILKAQRLERASLRRRLSGALSSALQGFDSSDGEFQELEEQLVRDETEGRLGPGRE
jgi:predicted acylesterase/phospholipase RssA